MGEAGADESSSARLPSAHLVVWGLTALLAVPLVVALVAEREPRWSPMSDQAEYEMYVRDVTSAHPPLVGLTGRIQAYGEPGAHPGPIGFYLLSPLYRLLGTDGWSLQAATAALVAAATGLCIWLAHRRGGWPFALAATASLALLFWGYGARILLETWNPHLPLVWWVVFLLAVWSVLCDDLKMLPLVVLAGSVCAQTHVSYVPLVAGLALVVAGTLMVRLHRSRSVDGDGDGDDGRESGRRLLVWAGGSGAVAGALWLPPVIEQARNSPGNLAIILNYFRNNQDERVPLGDAIRTWLDHFDVTDLVTSSPRTEFPYQGIPVNWVGVLVLGIWAGAAVVAWRHADAMVRRLHLVVGAAVLLGLLSMSRITGPPWPYLTYWAWGTTALLILATTWTLVVVGAAKVAGLRSPSATTSAEQPTRVARPWLRPTGAVLGATTLLLVGLATVEATDVEMTEPALSQTLGSLVGPTVDWLQRDPGPCGDDCRVLVTWTDEVNGGVQALGLVVALEREGIDARVLPALDDHVRPHRTSQASATDLEVRLVASHPAIAVWYLRPDAELVTSAQPTDQTAQPVAVFAQPAGASALSEPRL